MRKKIKKILFTITKRIFFIFLLSYKYRLLTQSFEKKRKLDQLENWLSLKEEKLLRLFYNF